VAQVRRHHDYELDLLLDRAIAAWQELTDVEREIDGWDLVDQLVFIEEWPLEEERLRRLADLDRADAFTKSQRRHYERLLRLVERQRPIIDRLRSA
jgi:predicted NUDIX family NTP pyrophosphohydrolase